MLNFGVIGYGYWGPNIVRNIVSLKRANVKAICDINPKARNKSQVLYPHIPTTSNYNNIIKSKDIDVVAIITPVNTHFKIAKKALEHGKHVFVEKPFTNTVEEAEILLKLAEKKSLKIMLDYVFLFTGSVQKIKELIANNTLGDLFYYNSLRSSFGPSHDDVNVIWDLAPHDFAILNYIFKYKSLAISAQGADFMSRGREDFANITIYYQNKFMAHINVNWLSPVKVRTIFIGGQKKMLIWDDLQTEQKLRIYNKKSIGINDDKKYRLMVDYRSGDMWSPHVDLTEPLKVELEYFVDCIQKDITPINDGHSALQVVKMLTAAQKSLKHKGKVIKL